MQESPSKSPFSFFTLTVYSPHSSQWSFKKKKNKQQQTKKKIMSCTYPSKVLYNLLSKIQSPYHLLAPNYLSDLISSTSLSLPTVSSFSFFMLMEYTIHIPDSGVLHQLLLPWGRLYLRHSLRLLPDFSWAPVLHLQKHSLTVQPKAVPLSSFSSSLLCFLLFTANTATWRYVSTGLLVCGLPPTLEWYVGTVEWCNIFS